VEDMEWINLTLIKIYVEGLYCEDEYWFVGVQYFVLTLTVDNLIPNKITYYKMTKRVLSMELHYNVRNIYLFLDWKDKQGRQCTYSVTFRCVRATIVAVEKQ
jgi:hypothetical protein